LALLNEAEFQLEAAHKLQETARALMAKAEQEQEHQDGEDVVVKVSKGGAVKRSTPVADETAAEGSSSKVSKRGSLGEEDLQICLAQGPYSQDKDIMVFYPNVWPTRLAPVYLGVGTKRKSYCSEPQCQFLPRGGSLYTIWSHVASVHQKAIAQCPLCTCRYTNPQSMRAHLGKKHSE
jgi:hypothetical protein